jgi:DNA-binding NarL/FixJ family response regulator
MEKVSDYAVLSVGQCGADEPQIRALLKKLQVSRVDQAHSSAEALQLSQKHPYDLILINRVLDATGESGHALLSKLLEVRPGQAVMLVSNYPDAHQEAVALGGLHGFGKRELTSAATAARVLKALSGGRD